MKKELSPFIKWAGGKTQLLEKIKSKFPSEYNEYYEPFVGGGALFLNIQPENAHINDINEQLINLYNQLKLNAAAVISEVDKIEEEICDKEYYYSIRDRYNKLILSKRFDAETAALMIWINKHCFNGLYRVNSKGLFNVPYNNSKRKNSVNVENLLGIGEYLQNVNITCQDFVLACSNVKNGDLVYFDSPYIPESETANFTSYTKDGFTYDDHKRLSDLFKELDKRGAYLILSNNDVDLVYELYEGYNIQQIEAKRMINRNADGRNGKEVIITNY